MSASGPGRRRHLRVVRSDVLTTSEQIEAVFTSRALYDVAAAVPEPTRVGRPGHHPPWVLLGYGVLARVFRSGARAEAELAAPGVWSRITRLGADAAQTHPGLGIPAATSPRPPTWNAFRYARDTMFTAADVQQAMREAFTLAAIQQARSLGLLDPNGPGSLCHPDRTRVIYGDGTVLRPLYKPPAAKRTRDPATGEVVVTYLDVDGQPIPGPGKRYDPDAAEYHGHAGPVHGQNYVGLYVRGSAPHQRVVLTVARVPRPGAEADTATAAMVELNPHLDGGAQAFVYDGAMRGRHIDELMTRCGVVAINKVHPGPGQAHGTGPKRWHTLGTWQHDTDAGHPCSHQMAAVDGAVSEFVLDETGNPAVTARLARVQVKRARRSTGLFHFNVAYRLDCRHSTQPVTIWVTPHGEKGDADHRRADALRIVPEGDPDFALLYGLRNDSEAFNSQLKRTLLVDRAMSLGASRQLLDVLCFGLLNNAANAYRDRRHGLDGEPRATSTFHCT